MLDDVERRAFLVDPARKHPRPIAVRALDVELDEGAGQGLNLPRRAGLARPEPNHYIADPDRLAGLQLELLRNTVALVE